MKMKNAAVSGILTFTYLLSSILLCTLVDALLLMILDKIVLLSFPVQTIIRLVIYSLGVPAIIGFVSYHEGYQTASARVLDSVVGTLLSAILHILLCLLFHFQAFIAGGIRFATGLIRQGMTVSFEGIAETPTFLFLCIFAVYTILYGIVVTICRYKGTQKRLAERAMLQLN